MAHAKANALKAGMKIDLQEEPYAVISNAFVKPGKGQPFNRLRLRSLFQQKVIEKTYKSGEKIPLADVEETRKRFLYMETDGVVFFDEDSFEQLTIPLAQIGDCKQWLIEDAAYDIVLYKGGVVAITPPTFLEMRIVETAPGARGDTAAGRVLKPAVTETGAKIHVPIFIQQGDKVRVDTRSQEYAGRI